MYGNCQARAVGLAYAAFLEGADYEVRTVRSWERLGQPQSPLSAAELGECVALFEQIDTGRFPQLDGLPAGCPVVRFPALDTNLLWPFAGTNPYDEARLPDYPGGRFPYGDRILRRSIEKDWSAERVITYYLERYGEYRVDLARVAELEIGRMRTRDASADVPMAGAIADVVTAPLFWSNNHPRAPLMATLARRLAEAGDRWIPELAAFSIADDGFDLFDRRVEAVPIHPGVAAELGLTWYDAQTRYRQVDGSELTFEEYVRAYVASSIEHRDRQLERGTGESHDGFGWRPPLDGPVRLAGRVFGFYPDGFAAPLLRFEIEATAPIENFSLDLYYPPQHRSAATIVYSVGSAKAEAVVDPGNSFVVTLPARLARGERARISLSCSEALNMLERGESEDNRDLGVLILAMRGV